MSVPGRPQSSGQQAQGRRCKRQRPTAILGMVLSPRAELRLNSLWATYKAWCKFCLCKCSIKGTNPPAPGLLPLESFCIHFSNDNSPCPPFLPHPPKVNLLKKPPYMVILLTHRQLAFLGTLFKEDPPLGFYIALVFLPKT